MPSDLATLYQLYKLDSELLEMKQRVASLDGGKAIKEQYDQIKSSNAPLLQSLEKAETRLKSAHEKSADYDQKIKKIEQMLLSGKVLNPKEIAGYEAEIAQFKKLSEEALKEELEASEALPKLQESAKRIKVELAKLAQAYKEKREADIELGQRLQAKYKESAAKRAPVAAKVSKGLLAQYEAIRSKYFGVGLSVVDKNSCGACGTNLPTRVLAKLDEDRIVTCEECHRLLFKPVAEE